LVDGGQTVVRLINDLGGNWEGDSAAAAGNVMQQAAQWSAASEPVTTMAGTGVEMQTESVERLRNGMPGGAPKPEYGFWDAAGDVVNQQTGNLFDVQTNFDDQVAQRRAADQEANRLLYAHEASSRANLAALPVLPPAPAITANAEIPPTICPPPIPPEQLHLLQKEERSLPNGEQKPPDSKGDENNTGEKRTETETNRKPTGDDTKPHIEDQKQEGPPPDPRDQGQTPPQQQIPPQQQRLQPEFPQTPPPGNTIPGQIPGQPAPRENVNLSSFVPPPPVDPLAARDQRLPSSAGFGNPGYGGGGAFTGGGFGGYAGGGGAGSFGPGKPESGGPVRGPGSAAGVGRLPAGGMAEPVRAAGPGSRGSMGTPMQPGLAGGRGEGAEDGEHTDKYWTHSDELFTADDIVVLRHGVIGENPGPER
jgi:hypothetical protein